MNLLERLLRWVGGPKPEPKPREPEVTCDCGAVLRGRSWHATWCAIEVKKARDNLRRRGEL